MGRAPLDGEEAERRQVAWNVLAPTQNPTSGPGNVRVVQIKQWPSQDQGCSGGMHNEKLKSLGVVTRDSEGDRDSAVGDLTKRVPV